MEGNIIEEIAQAEERAAKIRSEGAQRAALLLAEGDRRSQEIARAAETDCAILRADGMKRAAEAAEAEYARALDGARKSAGDYSEKLLKNTNVYVTEIVGRIVK